MESPKTEAAMNNLDSVWEKVEIRADNECWPWLGYTNNTRAGQRYGRLDIMGFKGVYAHRAVYMATNPGEITLDKRDGKCVLHKCDNGNCCNPTHLYVGTHLQNMRDKVERGRSKWCKDSTKAPRAKLTRDDVIAIRRQKKEGATVRALALLYEVSMSTISGCLYGRHYQDIQ